MAWFDLLLAAAGGGGIAAALRRVWKELREAQQDILAAERREDECQRQLADLRGRIEALEAGG
jgi:hypothetical protein